jgi:predicted GIY-YIG superfamily endonuclease
MSELEGFLPLVGLPPSDDLAPYVYALIWRTSIVYIGSTSGLRKRMFRHRSKRRKDLDYKFDRVSVKQFASISEARRQEYRLIRKYAPKHNTLGVEPTYSIAALIASLPGLREANQARAARHGLRDLWPPATPEPFQSTVEEIA